MRSGTSCSGVVRLCGGLIVLWGLLALPAAADVGFYTDALLSEPGLVGSYVNESLQLVTDSEDWRVTQTLAGTRIDTQLAFGTADWGARAEVGLTGGSDSDWNYFSVQWDGYIQVTEGSTRLSTCSDDGSRFWVDLDTDGTFGADELVDNNWGGAQGLRCGERSAAVPPGVYPIRVQYYEIAGANDLYLIHPDWAPEPFVASATNPVQTVKVIVINYEPRIPSEGNLRLWEVFNWSDPRDLVRDFIRDLEYFTGGAVQFEVVVWRHLDAFPVFTDGFQYDPDEYVANRRSNSGWHSGGADFYRMAEDEGLAELVNTHQVDEIWCFGDHYFGLFGEAWMAGPNGFFINGPTFPDIGFDRAIAGYGFNYERTVAEMVHNLGHRTENHGQRAFGSWNLANPQTAFDHFSANYNDSPGQTPGVGTCHIPANADAHYDYGDPRTVASTAFDWRNYPSLTGGTTSVDRDTWGFGPLPDYQRDYLNFYFGMMPRNSGVDGEGHQANWFKYIWDYNAYEAGTGLPRDEDAFASADKIRWAGGAFHPFTVRYYDQQAVDASTLGDGDVEVSGPNGFLTQAELVVVGPEQSTTCGTARTARYLVAAPEGGWQGAHAGVYTVTLRSGEVLDTAANAFPPGAIGIFSVEVDDPSSLDIGQMLYEGTAQGDHTIFDIGGLDDLFDGNTSSLVRTPAINPAQVTVTFDTAQTVTASKLYVSHTWGDPAYRWSLEFADDLDDMNGQTGSWQQPVDQLGTVCDVLTTYDLAGPVTVGVARLTVWRVTGDDYVHINDWGLVGGEAVGDSDGDGLPDDWEETHFQGLGHDGTEDTDGDGLPDAEEYHRGLDPNDPDSDGDGLSDGTEVVFGSDPGRAESIAQLQEVHVAFDFTGAPEMGNASAPFNTVTEGLAACAPGGTVDMDGAASIVESAWTGSVSKSLRLTADGGPVRVGVSAAPPPPHALGFAPDTRATMSLSGARSQASASPWQRSGALSPLALLPDGELERAPRDREFSGELGASTIREDIVPSLRDGDGVVFVAPDEAVALRLSSEQPLVSGALWGNLFGVEPELYTTASMPAADGDTREAWVIFQPTDFWPAGQQAWVAAGGEDTDGADIVSDVHAIRFDAWEAHHTEIPPLPQGILDAPHITVPNQVFSEPYRVWLPVPEGTPAEALQVFYYHDEPAQRGWYPAARVDGWLVPGSYQITEDDGHTSLSFLLHHGGLLQLGLGQE